MENKTQFETREEYLMTAVERLRPTFETAGYEIPKYKVSCGFGSRNAKRTLGECWWSTATDDKVRQMFISPVISTAQEVVGVLAHELLHAVLPDGSKHGPLFKKGMKKVGLEGKAIYAKPGKELYDKITAIVTELGVYPNSPIKMAVGPTRKNRKFIVKVACPVHDAFEVKIHVSNLYVGSPKCWCGREMD